MEILDLPVPSSDGTHTLAGHLYLPEGKPLGILHIVHGMTEHIARYDRVMRDLCKDGWLVCGYDNLGHGHTVKDPSELGFIAHKKGYEFLARDVGVFSDTVRDRYGRSLPYILLGHSMGSFIVRYATARRYARPDRLIIMGTGGPNPVAGVGLAAIGLMKALRGERHISPLIDRLAFGTYNARFGGNAPGADIYEWISTDKAVRDIYRADPLCTFKFTVSAMGDLVRLSTYTNRRSWFAAFPKDIPVLLVSGTDDPVGNYGKGVSAVERRLKKVGVSVTSHLYIGARHEILNDHSYPAVLDDLRAFLPKP